MSDTKMNTFIEYIKLHITSLEQDADRLEELKHNFLGDYDSEEYENLVLDDYYNTGELIAAHHLLKVGQNILDKGEQWTD
jgi:hypothetical protein